MWRDALFFCFVRQDCIHNVACGIKIRFIGPDNAFTMEQNAYSFVIRYNAHDVITSIALVRF